MFSKCGRSRAFVYTLDALLAASVIIGLTASLSLFRDSSQGLDRELLFQLAQDAVEACSLKGDLNEGCFDFLRETNPALDYCIGCNRSDAVEISRETAGGEFVLTIWVRKN